MARSLFVSSCFAFLSLASFNARAAVRVEAPPSCVRAAELERRLGAADDAEPVTVTVAPDNAGVRVIVRRGETERVLRVASCAHVAAAAETIVALARSTPEPPSEPEPEPAPKADPEPAAGVAVSEPPIGAERGGSPAETPRERSGLDWSASLAALTDVGSVASPTIGARAAVAAGRDRVRLELGGLWLVPQTSSDAVSVELAVVAGTTRACYDLGPRAPRLGACAGFELGVITSAGVGVVSATQENTLWAAPTLDGTLAIPLGRSAALAMSLGAGTPLARPTFYAFSPGAPGGSRDLHRTGPVFARASLGLELSL